MSKTESSNNFQSSNQNQFVKHGELLQKLLPANQFQTSNKLSFSKQSSDQFQLTKPETLGHSRLPYEVKLLDQFQSSKFLTSEKLPLINQFQTSDQFYTSNKFQSHKQLSKSSPPLLELSKIETYCFGNSEFVQLGPCSSTFLKCSNFNDQRFFFLFYLLRIIC